jgi:hypothetical protein
VNAACALLPPTVKLIIAASSRKRLAYGDGGGTAIGNPHQR